MEEAITKMLRWLVPGGRIFVVTMSPYHKLLKDFLPVYLKGVREGNPWPGEINNMHEIAPQLMDQIPNFLHVMETSSLRDAFKTKGLEIVKEGFFDYKRPSATNSDDKGYYGITVQKPKGI